MDSYRIELGELSLYCDCDCFRVFHKEFLNGMNMSMADRMATWSFACLVWDPKVLRSGGRSSMLSTSTYRITSLQTGVPNLLAKDWGSAAMRAFSSSSSRRSALMVVKSCLRLLIEATMGATVSGTLEATSDRVRHVQLFRRHCCGTVSTCWVANPSAGPAGTAGGPTAAATRIAAQHYHCMNSS